MGLGVCTVDVSAYAAEHEGDFYVFHCYKQNDYYTWNKLDRGTTQLEFTVIPGEELEIGVYFDASGDYQPRYSASGMRDFRLYDTIPYMERDFRELGYQVYLEDASDEITDVSTIGMSDLTGGVLKPGVRFLWAFTVSEDTRVDFVAVLRSPDGTLFKENFWFNWHPQPDGAWRYYYDASGLFNYCAQRDHLTTGTYQLDLYIDGRQTSSVPITVGSYTVPFATPTPKPTKTPTPKPTKTPTPRPTKTPTPRPTKTPVPRTFRVLTPTMDAGVTTIRWEDSENKGPYTVVVQHEYTSGGSRQLAARVTFANTSSKSASSGKVMVPGEPYTITVTDNSGKSATLSYRPTKQTYPDFKITPSFDLKVITPNGTKSGLASFSAADIKKNISTYDYGGYLKLGYPQIKYQRVTNWTLAFLTPNGDAYVDGFFEDDIPSGNHYTYWKHYSMNYLFQYLIRTTGSVPTGKYTWTLYFDGQAAGSTTFTVKK